MNDSAVITPSGRMTKPRALCAVTSLCFAESERGTVILTAEMTCATSVNLPLLLPAAKALRSGVDALET